MVVFLAGVQTRQLHRRIRTRFSTDGYFEAVQLRVAEPREPGPYRVVARTDPRLSLDDEAYPVGTARLEVGFELGAGGEPEPGHGRDHYWFNWIEPEREFLLGWHQDDDHPALGPVHVQVNQGGEAVVRKRATVVEGHPMAVVEARLGQVADGLSRVEWRDGRVVGVGW